MGIFVNGLNGGIGALMSEAYPNVARATAQNTLWNIGRAIGALGPITVGALTAKYPFSRGDRFARFRLLHGHLRDAVLDSGTSRQTLD
jgi:hypothetical protein